MAAVHTQLRHAQKAYDGDHTIGIGSGDEDRRRFLVACRVEDTPSSDLHSVDRLRWLLQQQPPLTPANTAGPCKEHTGLRALLLLGRNPGGAVRKCEQQQAPARCCSHYQDIERAGGRG